MVMSQVDTKHERILQVANNLIGYTALLALCPFVTFLVSQYGYLDRKIFSSDTAQIIGILLSADPF